VSLQIRWNELPRFERTMEFLEKSFLTKAHRTNGEYVKDHSEFAGDNALLRHLVFDPQTSGGLLLAVDEAAADRIMAELSRRFVFARKIGRAAAPQKALLQFS
jgi:selenide,water dikinase